MASPIRALNRTLETTDGWLRELCDREGLGEPGRAYEALRAVLHALRDRLTLDEGAHLAAQLPMLVRGIYYEGFRPSELPQKLRDREAFLARVGEELPPDGPPPDAATAAVIHLLRRHVSEGEVSDVRHMLPEDMGVYFEDRSSA